MIKIKKTYRLEEVEIEVNKRKIIYDFLLERAYYQYNKKYEKVYKLVYAKWLKLVKKYNLGQSYAIQRYEELNKCLI